MQPHSIGVKLRDQPNDARSLMGLWSNTDTAGASSVLSSAPCLIALMDDSEDVYSREACRR
jgi:hypothetical protein